MVKNSTNVNKTSNYLSSEIIKYKTNYDICWLLKFRAWVYVAQAPIADLDLSWSSQRLVMARANKHIILILGPTVNSWIHFSNYHISVSSLCTW